MSPLEEAASDAAARFMTVASSHGLPGPDTRCYSREATVTFASETVLLQIHLEAGCDPYVTVGAKQGEQFGLNQIVGDQAPERAERLLRAPGETEGDLLERLADLTHELAADILSGDFSSFPRLRRVRARMTREENIRDWGTSTGETPRFDHRPTLDELFADADNDGLVDARVYQGIWDFGYGQGELASYLGSTEAEIQMRLDRWDGLAPRR